MLFLEIELLLVKIAKKTDACQCQDSFENITNKNSVTLYIKKLFYYL